MAKKAFRELKQLTTVELTDQLLESRYMLFKLNITKKLGKLKNTARLWQLRKKIAMIKTLQSQQDKG